MIAVSGATGFLGSYVVCMLIEQGKSVRAFKRKSTVMDEFEMIFAHYFFNTAFEKQNQYRAKIEWVIADVNDIPSLHDALREVSDVYHCAAVVSFVQKDRDRLMKVNTEGTANMVNVSLLNGVKNFCHVSSIAALGRAKSGEHITENTKWHTSKYNSNYAVSKYKAELEVWRGAEEGLNVTIVNPGVILGVGDWNKGSTKLFKLVWKGMPFYTEGVNGYADVKDVARAMLMLMEKKVYSQRFVLVGKNVNMKWYLDTVATHLRKRKPTIKVNRFIAQLAWITEGIKCIILRKTPSLTKETARASLHQYFYSSDKIEQLGFTFTPMETTIAETCTQFLKTNIPKTIIS